MSDGPGGRDEGIKAMEVNANGDTLMSLIGIPVDTHFNTDAMQESCIKIGNIRPHNWYFRHDSAL